MPLKPLAACLFALVVHGVAADANEPITIGEKIRIHSRVLGEERLLLVSPPAGYDPDERYPVLYLTDAGTHLTQARGTADFLHYSGLVPPLIIVGVTHTDRDRDLTPTRGGLEGLDGDLRERPTSGGASRFLDFLEKELFPHVESRYSTLGGFRIYVGHSLGGLLGLHALFARPDMFDGIVAISPTLTWDDDLPLREARAFFQDRTELDVALVVTMGNEEARDPRPTRLDRLAGLFEEASLPGLQWQALRMSEESHRSVVLRSYERGLREIFRPWLVPVDPATGAYLGTLGDVVAHFQGISERHGIELLPAEAGLNAMGYRALLAGDGEEALAVFRQNVSLYPESPNVHDSLGEGLERLGRVAEAFASYSRAVDLASDQDDPNLGIFKANRDRVKKEL